MGWEPTITDDGGIQRDLNVAGLAYDQLASDVARRVATEVTQAEIMAGDLRTARQMDIAQTIAVAREATASLAGSVSGQVQDDVARAFAVAQDVARLDARPESVIAQAMGAPMPMSGITNQVQASSALPAEYGAAMTMLPGRGVTYLTPITALPSQTGSAVAPIYGSPPGGIIPGTPLTPEFPVGTLKYQGRTYPLGTDFGSVYVWGNDQYEIYTDLRPFGTAGYGWRSYNVDNVGPPPNKDANQKPPATAPQTPTECVALCGMDDLIEALTGKKDKECEPTKYKLYCRKKEGLILTGVDADAPSGAELVAEGVPATSWFKLAKDCIDDDKKDETEDKDKEKPRDKQDEQPRTVGVGGCEADVFVPLVLPPTFGSEAVATVLNEIGKKGNGFSLLQNLSAVFYLQTFTAWVTQLPAQIYKIVSRPVTNMLQSRNCDPSVLTGLLSMSIVGGILERYICAYIPWFNIPIQQSTNYHCPQNVPGSADAASAYLGNQIDEQTLECWVRMNGDKYPHFRKVLESRQSRLSVLEAINAKRRGLMTDQQFAEHCRLLGYLDPNIPHVIDKVTEQIPVLTDILRFMVRDAGDDVLAAKLGTDALFPQKFTGQLKQWADNQGITPDYAKYAWRSHWYLPSPTDLYKMYHRLRYQDIDPKLQVSEKDIEESLIQDDKLPYWVPRYLAISFRIPGRIDIKRAYNLGVMDEYQVRRAFQELGYDDKNADIQSQSTMRDVEKSRRNSPIIKQFIRGDIGLPQLETHLNAQKYSQNTIGLLVDYALDQREIGRISICLKSIKRGFLSGQYDDSQLQVELSSLKLDPEHISELTSRWNCERASRDKQATAAMLAGWYMEGSLDETEYYTRLINLRWNNTDAARMVQSSVSRLKIKTDREAKLAIKATEMEREKEARKLERVAKQAAANEAKRKREAQSVDAERAKFGVRILSAAEKLSAKSGEDIATTRDWLHGQVYGRMPASPLTPLEVVQSAQTVADLPAVIDRETFLADFLPLVS
jgi:hypothetical protein